MLWPHHFGIKGFRVWQPNPELTVVHVQVLFTACRRHVLAVILCAKSFAHCRPGYQRCVDLDLAVHWIDHELSMVSRAAHLSIFSHLYEWQTSWSALVCLPTSIGANRNWRARKTQYCLNLMHKTMESLLKAVEYMLSISKHLFTVHKIFCIVLKWLLNTASHPLHVIYIQLSNPCASPA